MATLRLADSKTTFELVAYLQTFSDYVVVNGER